MRKIAIRALLINISTYLTVYTIWTFVIWEFKNPFQWIIDIPTYSYDQRGMGLFAIALYYLAIAGIASNKSSKS